MSCKTPEWCYSATMADKTFTLRLPEDLHRQLGVVAEQGHISLNTAVIHAIKLLLAQREGVQGSPVAPLEPTPRVKVTTRRDRTRFDDGDDPDVPMPQHAVEVGRALGRLNYVLRLVTAKTKLRGAVAEECDDALAFVSMVSQYLTEDGPRPPSNSDIVEWRTQGRPLSSQPIPTVVERIQ
ncbi:toxin-antitoxin system HicB family antitoxin [Nocardia otitidiscaviarum]|uniref:toxin-antitoxin system HicB family antitoxin n=1 Tax=Nocardia otitidiscaviarum TaxID=1823 RepID=UPI0020D17D70|nr:toxin-antitoxin system HicB family antitoxin [Nocardia otitidiscaviarum]